MFGIFRNELKRNWKRNKRTQILTFLQFFLSFILMSVSIINYDQLYNAQTAYANKYLDARFYQLSDRFTGKDEEDFRQQADNLQRLKRFHDVISQQKGIAYIETIRQPIVIPKDHMKNEVMLDGYEEGHTESFPISGNTLYNAIKTFRINLTAQREYGLSAESGRMFEYDDFIYDPGKPIPIVIGNELGGAYEIGDKIPGYFLNTACDFQIAGILPKDTSFLNRGQLEYLDRYFLMPSVDIGSMPLTPEQKSFQMMNYLQKINGVIKSKLSESDIIKVVSSASEKANIETPYIMGIATTSLILWNNMSKDALGAFLLLSILSVIFSAIGLSTIITTRFYANIKNYAVHLICGGTQKNIFSYFLGEVCLIVCSALLLSAVFVALLLKENLDPAVLYLILTGIFSILIACTGPAISIYKKDIIQILRRTE